MSDVWSDRAQAFRESPTHREGPDLDLVVEWCEPGAGVKALDVATGGGHVAYTFEPHVARVWATDITQEMLDMVKAEAACMTWPSDMVPSRYFGAHRMIGRTGAM